MPVSYTHLDVYKRQVLGLGQDEALAALAHGAQVTASKDVNEEGNPIKKDVTVALTDEPADTRTGTPTVYLGLNEEGKVVQAGYSASTAALGYGTLSFADAVKNEHVVEKTLQEAGIPVAEGAAVLPEDKTAYSTYDLSLIHICIYRPSPLCRAYNLERALGTPAKIYYKFEGNNTSGSHKLNSAIAQAYYAKAQELTGITLSLIHI